MEFLALFAGLAGLWLGTEWTLVGAAEVARHLRVSEFIIGVVVLSVGSDLPELAIAVDAALKNLNAGDASDLVVGSALGSSIGQIGFVLGVVALLGYLTLPRKTVYEQGTALLGSLILVAVVGLDGQVSCSEGAFLVVAYAAYVVYNLAVARRNGGDKEGDSGGGPMKSLLYLVAGLGVIVICAEITVSSAIGIATQFGIEQSFVAIIIIGLGSSLPELSISLGAMVKRKMSLSIGNLFGSNVFDTLIPIGVAAMISGLRFDAAMLRVDLPFLFVLTTVVLLFFLRKAGVQRREANVILGMYLTYAAVKLIHV